MQQHDPIRSPSHYQVNGRDVEVKDILKAAGLFPDYAKGNILKYTLRAGKKAGESATQDLRKAAEYATELADYLDEPAQYTAEASGYPDEPAQHDLEEDEVLERKEVRQVRARSQPEDYGLQPDGGEEGF